MLEPCCTWNAGTCAPCVIPADPERFVEEKTEVKANAVASDEEAIALYTGSKLVVSETPAAYPAAGNTPTTEQCTGFKSKVEGALKEMAMGSGEIYAFLKAIATHSSKTVTYVAFALVFHRKNINTNNTNQYVQHQVCKVPCW
jgi:hypothetical protein